MFLWLAIACASCQPARTRLATLELYFHDPTLRAGPSSSCEIPLCTSLLEAIGSASARIDFAAYGMRSQPGILQALRAARARGVRVRGVIDRDVDGRNPYPDTDALAAVASSIRDDREADAHTAGSSPPHQRDPSDCRRPDGTRGPLSCFDTTIDGRRYRAAQASQEPIRFRGDIMHNKFFVIDERLVWTGSANLSDTDTGGYNANVGALVDSPDLALRYTREFERLHTEGRFHAGKTTERGKSHPTPLTGGGTIEALFSPQEHPVDRALLPLIRSSRREIDAAIFFLTSKRIAEELLAAQARGVQVRVLLDATGAANAYSKHALLREGGVSVKVESWGGKMHAKAASFDGRHLLLGSMNWTSAGERRNDENTLVLRSVPKYANEFKHTFDALWQSVPDRWLRDQPNPESSDSGTACSDGIDNDYDGEVDLLDPGCAAPHDRRTALPGESLASEEPTE